MGPGMVWLGRGGWRGSVMGRFRTVAVVVVTQGNTQWNWKDPR